MPCTEKELERRRKRYALNIGAEREQARIRSQSRRQNMSGVSLEIIRERKERNLEIQAAYRRGNRLLLKTKAWKYRMDKKYKKKLQEEAEEADNSATSKAIGGDRELGAPPAHQRQHE